MSSPWLALSPGIDPTTLARQIAEEHDLFVSSSTSQGRVRPVVLDSWTRSRASGVDADGPLASVDLTDADLVAYRDAHPLAAVMPVVRRLLVEDAIDCDLLVAVTDAHGRLLWVEGAPGLRRATEAMHFVPGARWGEAEAGTNAPGTALAIDHAVQVFSHEHYARVVQPWSCTAAPIHDPRTGAILGALDVTGKDSVATPHAMALVQAAVYAVESELRMRSAHISRRPPSWPVRSSMPRLSVLGAHQAQLLQQGRTTRLSLRHSEIVLLLSLHPAGLTTDQLAIELSDTDGFPVTVRAEVSRLRRVLGALAPTSKPYRLPVELDTDAAGVKRHLRAGHLDRALSRYVGPILPRSDAPGVVRARQRLRDELRAAVLCSDRRRPPDAMGANTVRQRRPGDLGGGRDTPTPGIRPAHAGSAAARRARPRVRHALLRGA